MTQKISRRKMLGISAGATAAVLSGSNWRYVLDGEGNVVRAATKDSASDWKPVFLSKKQAEQVAAVCEAIIPKTDTPGARDAKVHQYIDLSLSVEAESRQKNFKDGLKWLDKYCKDATGNPLHKASGAEVISVLTPISDEHDSHPDDLKTGAAFFRDIKTRTIFGYYTSLEGRVGELGLSPEVEMITFHGCTHAKGTH